VAVPWSKWKVIGARFNGWEEKPENLLSGCKKSSRGFTGYQSCDWSDIFQKKDNSDEHYSTQNPLIYTELASWIAFSGAWYFVEPLCHQLATRFEEGQSLENNQPQLKSFNYHDFPPPIMKVEMQEPLARLHWNQDPSQLWCIDLFQGERRSQVWPWSDFLAWAQLIRTYLSIISVNI